MENVKNTVTKKYEKALIWFNNLENHISNNLLAKHYPDTISVDLEGLLSMYKKEKNGSRN